VDNSPTITMLYIYKRTNLPLIQLPSRVVLDEGRAGI